MQRKSKISASRKLMLKVRIFNAKNILYVILVFDHQRAIEMEKYHVYSSFIPT